MTGGPGTFLSLKKYKSCTSIKSCLRGASAQVVKCFATNMASSATADIKGYEKDENKDYVVFTIQVKLHEVLPYLS